MKDKVRTQDSAD